MVMEVHGEALSRMKDALWQKSVLRKVGVLTFTHKPVMGSYFRRQDIVHVNSWLDVDTQVDVAQILILFLEWSRLGEIWMIAKLLNRSCWWIVCPCASCLIGQILEFFTIDSLDFWPYHNYELLVMVISMDQTYSAGKWEFNLSSLWNDLEVSKHGLLN